MVPAAFDKFDEIARRGYLLLLLATVRSDDVILDVMRESEVLRASLRSDACTSAFGRGRTRPAVAEDVYLGRTTDERPALDTTTVLNTTRHRLLWTATHDTAKIGCGPVQRISRRSIPGGCAFSELWFPTIPKVGSSTLREESLPALVGCTKGQKCMSYTQNHRMGACQQGCPSSSRNGLTCHLNASARATMAFVRDPLAKLVSAFREIVLEGALKNGLRCFRAVQEGTLAPTLDCQHARIDGVLTPSKSSDEFARFIIDVDRGYRNWHMFSQSLFLLSAPHAKLELIGRLERGSDVWRAFMARTKVRTNVSLGHAKKTNPRTDVIDTSAFGEKHWSIFCEYFRQDYACLSVYTAPDECKERWAAQIPRMG